MPAMRPPALPPARRGLPVYTARIMRRLDTPLNQRSLNSISVRADSRYRRQDPMNRDAVSVFFESTAS
jgi:hypothetical protein